MIPIQDTIRSRQFSWMNYSIILMNALVFLYQLRLPAAEMEQFFFRFGAVPTQVLAEPSLAQIGTLFSSMFVHGGWFHLISNMWALFIFGDNINDCMGGFRYLFFYITAGLGAAALHIFMLSESNIPVVGASGAIAGVMGAYVILYPKAKVITLIPLGFFWFVRIPAVIFLGFWFFSQLGQGLLAITADAPPGAQGGVAWWAHIGGFVIGMILVLVLRDREAAACSYEEDYSPW